MKSFTLLCSFLFFYLPATAQRLRLGEDGTTAIRAVRANNPLILNVLSGAEIIKFSDAMDYSGPKVLPAYYQLRISVPPLPWLITAKLAEVHRNFDGPNVPKEKIQALISLRSDKGIIYPLSQKPQNITMGIGGPTEQYIIFDLIIQPPFDLHAGSIMGMIDFQLQLQ